MLSFVRKWTDRAVPPEPEHRERDLCLFILLLPRGFLRPSYAVNITCHFAERDPL